MAISSKQIWDLLTDPGECKTGASYVNLPLTGSVLPIMLLQIVYLAFVLKIGPGLMKNREPFDLRRTLLVYNTLQIIVNFYVVISAILLFLRTEFYDFGCVEQLPEGHPEKRIEVFNYYIYYTLKWVDYLDTIFFVLRKSYKQVSFLHVYHHVLMTTIVYLHIRDYGLGGHSLIVAIFNSFVHGLMYSYYLLSALRPSTTVSLWWKKYITQVQIVQFLVILCHLLWALLIHPNCEYPRRWILASMSQDVLILFLFCHFYWNVYLKPRAVKKEE